MSTRCHRKSAAMPDLGSRAHSSAHRSSASSFSVSGGEGAGAASDEEASAPVGTRSFALSGASRPLSISPAMTTRSAGCVQDCSAARVKDSRRTRCTPPDAVTWSSSFQPASCTSTMPARWHGRAWPCCATASAQTWGVILSEGEWRVVKGLILEERKNEILSSAPVPINPTPGPHPRYRASQRCIQGKCTACRTTSSPLGRARVSTTGNRGPEGRTMRPDRSCRRV